MCIDKDKYKMGGSNLNRGVRQEHLSIALAESQNAKPVFFFFLIIAKPVCFCSETAMIVGLLFYCPLHAKFTWVCIRPFGFGPLPLGQAFCFITGLNWYWPEKNFSFHYGLFGFLFFFFNRVHFSMIYYLEEISLYLIQTNYN